MRYDDFSIFFQNGGHPPSWICYTRVWTTHEEYLVVFVTVQKLVEIVAEAYSFYHMHVLIICALSLKMSIHVPKMGFGG